MENRSSMSNGQLTNIQGILIPKEGKPKSVVYEEEILEKWLDNQSMPTPHFKELLQHVDPTLRKDNQAVGTNLFDSTIPTSG